jgi:predicted nucleic acid-binding protein
LKQYVVDASVAVKWIVQEEKSLIARQLLAKEGDDFSNFFVIPNIRIAPALLPLEVHYTVAKKFIRKEVSLDQLVCCISAILEVIDEVIPLDNALLEKAAAFSFGWALEGKPLDDVRPFGIYDCIYIAVASQFGATLVTSDKEQNKLARLLDVETILI